LAAVLLALPVSPVRAAFLIDPSGGTNFAASIGNNDDGSVTRSLGGTFNFYGAAQTSVNPGSNGYLAFGANSALRLNRPIGDLAGIQQAPVIAPLYNDLYIISSTRISDKTVAGQYYAVTYEGITAADNAATPTLHARDPNFSDSFQVALFLGNTTVGGFHFLAGDIAFSYGPLNAPILYEVEQAGVPLSVTVGVANNSTNFTGVPGNNNGFVTDLTSLPTGNNFLLYRPGSTAGSGYSVTVASTADGTVVPTATPEPASLVSAAIAGVIGLGCAWYRRTRASA